MQFFAKLLPTTVLGMRYGNKYENVYRELGARLTTEGDKLRGSFIPHPSEERAMRSVHPGPIDEPITFGNWEFTKFNAEARERERHQSTSHSFCISPASEQCVSYVAVGPLFFFRRSKRKKNIPVILKKLDLDRSVFSDDCRVPRSSRKQLNPHSILLDVNIIIDFSLIYSSM